MRRVLYDGEVVHDPMFGPQAVSATLRLEDGSAGTLSFALPPTHPLAGSMAAMDATREVTVEVDGEEVFRGRLLSDGMDGLACVSYEAAGQLSYLSDSVVRPYGTYESDEWAQVAPRGAGDLFRWYVERHNEQVGPEKRFAVGRCEATGAVTRSSTQRPKTRDEVRDKLVEPLGLSLRARWENGVRVLDLLSDGDADKGREACFGENIVDFAVERDASDVVTEIVPTATGGDERFGLETVTDGTYHGYWVHGDAMRDTEAARRYGVVQEARDYDVSTPDGLLSACARDLASSSEALESVECSAADFDLRGPSGPVGLHEQVLVTSEPHGVRQRMTCSAVALGLLDPSNDRYSFGALMPTLTRAQAKAASKSRVAADESARSVAAISQEAKDAAIRADAAGVASWDEYAISDSNSDPPADGWSDETPSWEDGVYVWRRAVTAYGDGTTVEGSPAVMTGNTGRDGEDATVLYVDSSRGYVFKNNLISTQLRVIITKGGERVADAARMREVYGPAARIEWRWQRVDDPGFGTISAGDPRVSEDGFALTVSPDDVDVKTVFTATLII